MNRPHKAITISRIAAEAGVSPATVSRVINNPDKVNSDNYSKVMAVISELGYILPQQRSSVTNPEAAAGVIILNIPMLGNPVFSDYTEGVIASATKHNWHVFISTETITPQTCDGFLSSMRSGHALGLISMNICNPATLQYINSSIPVIQCMERHPDIGIPYVCVDDYAASINAVEYLIRCGKRNIGLVTSSGMVTSSDRQRGYFEAMQRNNLVPDPSLVVQTLSMRSNMMRSLFKQAIGSFRSKPDAFFCSSDQIAHAVLVALMEQGYRVPEDIAIIGFDDSDISDLAVPRISTVGYAKYEAGYIACEMLYERFMSPSAPIKDIVLDTELVLRQTTP